jgi:hypothetical protein
MHNVNRQQFQKSDLKWLHLDRLDHLHVILDIQEVTHRDLSITCRKGNTPYGHFTKLDTHLELGVRVRSIGVATERSDVELRRHGR